jgi:hypothetical protein
MVDFTKPEQYFLKTFIDRRSFPLSCLIICCRSLYNLTPLLNSEFCEIALVKLGNTKFAALLAVLL